MFCWSVQSLAQSFWCKTAVCQVLSTAVCSRCHHWCFFFYLVSIVDTRWGDTVGAFATVTWLIGVLRCDLFRNMTLSTLAPPPAFAGVSSDAQLTPVAPPTAECNVDHSKLLFDVSIACRTSLGHRSDFRCARDDVSNRRKHGKGSE